MRCNHNSFIINFDLTDKLNKLINATTLSFDQTKLSLRVNSSKEFSWQSTDAFMIWEDVLFRVN